MKWQWISYAEQQARLTPRLWKWVFAAMIWACLPLLYYLPKPLSIMLGATIIVKIALLYWQRPRLVKYALGGLFIAGIAILAWLYLRHELGNFFIGFLTLTAAGKLLETSNERDVRVLFLLQLCLFTASLMFSQSLLIFIWLCLAIYLSFVALAAVLQRRSALQRMGSAGALGKIFAVALPCACVLFFIFPRFAPLWRLPSLAPQGVTGLPAEMNMQNLSSLAQSNAVAFRVHFDGNPPAARNLYWRGHVLWQYADGVWRQRPFARGREQLAYQADNVTHYTLTPANGDSPWLTALTMPVQVERRYLQLGSSGEVRIRREPQRVRHYALASALDYRLQAGHLPSADYRLATATNAFLNYPKTAQLAARLRAESGGSMLQFAQFFMQYLRENQFQYSLAPPAGSGNPENFLFTGKIGFCQQYANAMAITARLANIPARVVIGYQGGERNPMTGEWVVRQKNAHAWVELWSAQTGWQRFDPTRAALGGAAQNAAQTQTVQTAREQIDSTPAWRRWLNHATDAVETQWQNWVINLNMSQQQRLWTFLKINYRESLAIVLLGLGMLACWGFWRKRRSGSGDKLAQAGEKVIKTLSKQGFPPQEGEAFAPYLRRVGNRQTNKKAYLLAAACYERVRYGNMREETLAIQLLKSL